MTEPNTRRFRVIPAETGMTLRALLARRLPETGSDQAAALCRAGGVFVNRLRVRLPLVRVAAGERVTVHLGAAEVPRLDPATLGIVYRDEWLIVIDKPVDVPVAPTRETAVGTLTQAVLDLLTQEGVTRPYVGLLHRIDRRASGLVLFTTRNAANPGIQRQFKDHTIGRKYRLLVHGHTPDHVICELPIARLPDGGVRVAERGEPSQAAHSMFRTLEQRDALSLLEAELSTGRQHQVRIHAAALGFPILGDRRYGREDGADRMHLHAYQLQFNHPVDGRAMRLESPNPLWANSGQTSV